MLAKSCNTTVVTVFLSSSGLGGGQWVQGGTLDNDL